MEVKFRSNIYSSSYVCGNLTPVVLPLTLDSKYCTHHFNNSECIYYVQIHFLSGLILVNID